MGFVDTLNNSLRKIPTWLVYIVATLWVGWLFYLGAATNQLGPDPIETLEHSYGELALKLLVLGLAVTPLRNWTGVNLMRFRRAIGVTAFFVVLAHFSVWALLDVKSWDRIWVDVVKRPYVTIGMLSLLLLVPLAVTSNNLSLRKVGALRWRKLHKLVYPAAFLAALHYVWLVKGFQIEPIVYLTLIAGLILVRGLPKRTRRISTRA